MIDLNQHNQDYYRKFGTRGVPDILATAKPIQEAIRLEVEARIGHDPIRVLELGFGSRPDRYLHIAKTTTRQWEVTLSDFDLKVLPDGNLLPNSIKINYLKYNLLTDPLPQESFDVILSTYVFDSIDWTTTELVNFIQTIILRGSMFLTIDKWIGNGVQDAGGARFRSVDS